MRPFTRSYDFFFSTSFICTVSFVSKTPPSIQSSGRIEQPTARAWETGIAILMFLFGKQVINDPYDDISRGGVFVDSLS